MSQEYKKTLPMIIAYLSIALSIAVPLVYVGTYFKYSHDVGEESNDPYESRYFVQFLIGVTAACIFLWTLPSVLLIKGIKENRPKLMAPWLYLVYLSLFALICGTIWVYLFIAGFSGSAMLGLKQCLPLVIIWVITLLLTIPARKLYNQFRQPAAVKPAPVEPTCAAAEDDKRYMPIFENC